MDYIRVLVVVLTAVLLAACSAKVTTSPYTLESRETPYVSQVPPTIPVKRTQIKAIDPFEGKTFTFSASRAQVQSVLYALAVDLGLNLVVGPDVSGDTVISANFLNTPTSDAIDVIMEMADIYYEVHGNILRIYKYHTTNFNLPYINMTSTLTSDLGGDVAGNLDQEGGTELSGGFELSFNRDEAAVDFYTQLEDNVATILGADPNSSATFNKMTGIISLYSTRSKTKEVSRLLDNVVENSVRQVQIEAKIVEVILSDSWSYGVNWDKVFSAGDYSVSTGQQLISETFAGTASVVGGSFSGMLNLVAQYGKVDTLANPRLTVMNGQTAMITAGTILPYWDVTREDESSAMFGTTSTYTYEKFTVLDGIMFGVTPFIHDDGKVMLNVVPISTTKGEDVEMIGVDGNVVAIAPELNIKEAGTVVQVSDGDMLVLGGLISNNKSTTSSRIPILGDIPLLGYLFSSDSVSFEKREMVIFIKPTIIYGDSKVIIK
jgi:MSHA biogenesis protein MshL